MNQDEGAILSEVMQNLPCRIILNSYNDAVSLKARLKKYVRRTKDICMDMNKYESPYDNLEIIHIKPRTLRFELRVQVRVLPADEANPIDESYRERLTILPDKTG